MRYCQNLFCLETERVISRFVLKVYQDGAYFDVHCTSGFVLKFYIVLGLCTGIMGINSRVLVSCFFCLRDISHHINALIVSLLTSKIAGYIATRVPIYVIYFTTLMLGWLMNNEWNWFRRNRSWLNRGFISGFSWRDWGKQQESLSVLAKIGAEHNSRGSTATQPAR